MNYYSTHIRVVAALVVREMSTRFGNKPGGYIWALIEPSFYVLFMGFVSAAIARIPPLGTSFPLFFASGYIAYQFYQAMVGFMNGAVNNNRSLLSYPSVAPIDTIFARYILQFATTVVAGVFIFGFIHFIGEANFDIRWPPVIEAAFAATLLALGVALMNNVLFIKYPSWERIYGVISRPLLLFSGVYFLTDSVPDPFHEILLYNPIAHIIMLFRTGFYPEYRADGLDMEYMYGVSMVVLFFAYLLFTMSREVLRGR